MKMTENVRNAGLTRFVLAISGFIVALHLAGFFFPGSLNWGFHFLGFLPWTYTLAYCLVFGVLLGVFFRTDVERGIARAAGFFRSKPLFFLLAAMAGFTLFALLFRVKASLLGDSFTVINNYQEYERGISPLAPWKEPFSMFFFYYAIRAFGSFTYPGLFWSFFNIQLFLGFAFIATAFLIARHLVRDERQQLLVFLFSLVFPYTIFFCGYIEIYAFSFLMLAVFILASLLVLEGKLPFSVVPVVYVFLTFSHYINGALIVSVLYLAYLEYRKRGFTQLAVGFGGAVVSVAVIFASVQFDITRLLDVSPVSHQLSLSGNVSMYEEYSQAYTLFSAYHFADIANYIVLMAPLPVGIILYLAAKQKGGIAKASTANAWFLCALVPVFAYYFFAKLEQGNADDWDVFAPHYFILNLFAALLFFQSKPVGGNTVFGLITALSLFLSMPWMTLNATGGPSIERFLRLWDKRNVSHLGHYTMALRLTRYYDAVNDTVSPANVWQRYRGIFPGDPRGYANEISSLKTSRAENGRRLLGVYEEWFKLEPENPAVRRSFAAEGVNLGTMYYSRGRSDSARALYSRALLIDSTNARALNNLGSVYAEEGRLDLAISLFHKAVFHDSSFSDAYYNLGMAYGDAGEKEQGLIYLRKASALGNAAARKALQ